MTSHIPSILVAALALLAATARAAEPGVDEQVLRAQLFLDASAFKPGVIDARWGEFTRKALVRFEKAHGKEGGTYGDEAPAKFDLAFDEARPVRTTYRLTEEDQKFIGELPEGRAQQAKLERLPYENLLELVAEKFHARRDFIEQLNPGFDWTKAKPGDEVQVPNVAAPFSVQEPIDLKTTTEKAEKADTLKTESEKPENERHSIAIDVSENMMELRRDGKLVGSYPITPGSKSLPAPEGKWFVKGFAWMPTFRWDEAMLQRGERSGNSVTLPPGPNNPVGIIWIELNRDGIGLHGTGDPETIGRAASHGCIRLANWDALDLAKKVLPGVHVMIK